MTSKFGLETWSDDELLERMLEREGGAWREFHRRFDRLIFRCIHKITCRFSSVVGNDDVREIYAMLLMNLTARDMHKLRCFQPERGNKLSSWIGLLATNTARDYLRGCRRQPRTIQLADACDVRTQQADACDRLLQKERWRLVAETLQTFSQKDRYFVQLYFLDGLTPEEIAAEMSISVKTVYSKKHKIRCRLERAMGREPIAA